MNSIFRLARGEFRGGIDPDVAMDLIFGPIVYRVLSGHTPLSKPFVRELVDAAVNGLANTAKTARPTSFPTSDAFLRAPDS